eukprot:3860322-Rhodomonas_salina.2
MPGTEALHSCTFMRFTYAMYGTGNTYNATSTRACYAMSGTERAKCCYQWPKQPPTGRAVPSGPTQICYA